MNIHKDKSLIFFWILIFSFFICSSIYSYLFIKEYSFYLNANHEFSTENVRWSVLKKRSDQYLLQADYLISIEGISYEGTVLCEECLYKNQETAESDIKEKKNLPSRLFFDIHNPTTASFHRSWPVKRFIYTLILWGITSYFLLLNSRAFSTR